MPPIDTRDVQRDSVFLLAHLTRARGGPSGSVRIRNLSAGGSMVEGELRLGRGERVEIELRNIGTVAGTVVWARGGRLGIAFDHLIDPKLARVPV
jgi:hypothetical protein